MSFILNTLDFDDAGRKYRPWWEENFPQSTRWPVPSGKDPGDYRKAGGDIRAWIIAGLPYGLRPAPPVIIKPDYEIDKKACLPILEPSTSKEADLQLDANGFITESARCTRCGRIYKVKGLPGSEPYWGGPCYPCLEKDLEKSERKPEKVFDRPNP